MSDRRRSGRRLYAHGLSYLSLSGPDARSSSEGSATRMSALGQKADMTHWKSDVRFTPKSGHQLGLEGVASRTL
jgi:hypothetical protein